MPDTKITALTAIVTVDPVADVLPIVDVSDTSMAASGTTKKITTNQILGAGGTATLGTLAVTGATTLTGALTANGAVNLGDAVGDAIAVNGSLTAFNGNTPSSVRAAASNYGSIVFDSVASTRVVASGQAIGTADFTSWVRFRVPTQIATSNAPGLLCLTSSNTTGSTANAFRMWLTDTGHLIVERFGATTSDFRREQITGMQAAYSGQVVDVIVTRSGNTLKVYINGTDTAYSTTTAGTPPNWGDSIVSDFVLVGAITSAASGVFLGRIYRAAVYNRAITAAEVLEVITFGVNPADQWGTSTAVWTSDFSAGVDSFIGLGGANSTLAGNIDGIGGQNDNLRNTSGTFTGNITGAYRSGLTRGKRFRITYSYFVPSSNSVLRGVRTNFFNGILGATGNTTLDAWTTFSEVSAMDTFTSGSNTNVSIHGTDSSGNINFNGTSGDVMYLRAVTLERVGAFIDLNFAVGTGFQAIDRSTNNLHGTLIGSVAWSNPDTLAVLYATTNTSGNQQMLGSTALPTNAVIEDIIVNSTGSATVSVGNVSAGTQIVNGASVVSGRQRLTIATPFTTTGNLWVNSSSTATLQFTILYTIAA